VFRKLYEGTAEPDSERCVDIATTAALKCLIHPGVLAVAAPTVVGFGTSAQALDGMLGGALLGKTRENPSTDRLVQFYKDP